MRKRYLARTALGALAATVVSVSVADASPITLDPLHGCIIGTTCFDNGTVTPTTVQPLPNFTFTVSPGPNAGDFLVEILVPNNVPGAGSMSFSISGTSAGSADTSTIGPDSAVFKGDWTSGNFDTFLSLSLANGSPKDPLSSWLSYTQGSNCGASQNSPCDAGATGYDVYQVDLGDNELQGPSNPTAPVLSLTGSLPTASVLAGFLGNGTTFGNSSDFISTAPSGGIFEADAPPTTQTSTTPEPASLFLLGSGLVLGAKALRRRKRPEAK